MLYPLSIQSTLLTERKLEDFERSIHASRCFQTQCHSSPAWDMNLRTYTSGSDLKMMFELSSAPIFINSVVIYSYFRTSWYKGSPVCQCCDSTLEIFQNCLKEFNNGSTVSVYSGDEKIKECGVWMTNMGQTQEDQTYTFECHAYGNRVQVDSVNKTDIVIAEVVVFGRLPGNMEAGVSIAIGLRLVLNLRIGIKD